VAVSAVGLGRTGLAELVVALLTGSVGLLGDAIDNLSDVSTSAVVFLGFRLSRRPPSEKYPRSPGPRTPPDRCPGSCTHTPGSVGRQEQGAAPAEHVAQRVRHPSR
jgi:hypothetical protein